MSSLTIPSQPLPAFPRKVVPVRCAFCSDSIINPDSLRHPYLCPNGHKNFRSPQTVAVAVVLFGSKIALVRRGRQPRMGLWGAPGGFMEWGDTTQRTALKEFGQEVFGLPVDLELDPDLARDMDWLLIGERPGTDEMSHLFFWGAVWPEGLEYVLPEPVVHDPSTDIPNESRPEVLEVGLYEMGEIIELRERDQLAYPYQVDFFNEAIGLLVV